MLSFVSLLEWADLALISVAAEPIKQEFEFSDTQLGILMGFAFVLFRMAALIPIGSVGLPRKARHSLGLPRYSRTPG